MWSFIKVLLLIMFFVWFQTAYGRFLSVDPKRQYANPYSYGGNNPVNLIDPTGEDFTAEVDNKEKLITVQATIYVYGKGSNPLYAKMIEDRISKKWNAGNPTYTHSPIIGEDTTYDLVFKPNVVHLDEDPSFLDLVGALGVTDNYVAIPMGNVKSWVIAGKYGVWLGESVAAHEFGHLLGLNDRYHKENGAMVSDKGWENNIMGAESEIMRVDQRNLDGIGDRISSALSIDGSGGLIRKRQIRPGVVSIPVPARIPWR